MKHIALLTAAGIGSRMNYTVPKQFVKVHKKPVIVYTMEAFQKHSKIDVIAVVCLKGWEKRLLKYAKQYHITKLKHIVLGGASGQESIKNGLSELEKYYDETDIVLIHDGVRPLVSEDVITDCISVTKDRGNAIAAIPSPETIFVSMDGRTSNSLLYAREKLKRTQTPHGFILKNIIEAHKLSMLRNVKNTASSCVLMVLLGNTIFFSKGSIKNIKLTFPEDFILFKALLSVD